MQHVGGWLFVLLALLQGYAFGADSPLNEARSALDKWVETKHLVSKARSDWQSDKEMLEQTAQLYERELRSIEGQMSKISTNNAQVEKERMEAEALKKSAGEALDKTRDFASM